MPRLSPPAVGLLKRALLVTLFLLVASCSGGGCSSGCASCGTAPLPGGFPKSSTIENAASVRVTRPGLNFLQENLSSLASKALAGSAATTNGVAKFPIPKSSQTGVEVCPPAAPVSPQCEAEINVGDAKLRINAVTPHEVKLDGTLPVRIRDLPVKLIGFIDAYVVAGDAAQAPGGNLCSLTRGAATFPYKDFPLNVVLPLVAETRVPRDGYTKVDVDNATIDIGITKNDIAICSAGGVPQGVLDFAKDLAFNSLIGGVKDQIKSALASGFCTAPSPGVTPPCPNGSTPDNADVTKATKCVFAGGECVPALLGTDGRLDLSKALASFSPGTKGGLDFVLASAGDMNPAPGTPGVPNWTPRKPPVPAADNNANGISLKLLGGAKPFPETTCVDVVPNDPPKGIPIPAELLGDTVTPWPQGTPGPHMGIAIAGRFLDHAFTSAYNSGALCLGVSTEQVDQLSSGYLSLLAPSIKNLTFEQAPGSAAITTRPGVPPKVTIGGGTDVKTDPLLKVKLERFAIDFYVFSSDRYVRIFTYTADVTIPINLQTGKDPKTNPNGGLLPVLGDLGIANASISNAEVLLFEDAAALSGSVTGLLGGLLGQFLGGGLSPIDLQSALQSVGLGLDIPSGGIRKLTSGTDDFLAIFANLQTAAGAAREEADTRALLEEKIVDKDAMGLGTAVRARFPKLRVRVEGIASQPTEHTWWVDRGTRAPWTTSTELLVDQDAMLLQGRHVLYVASRVVGVASSEDASPVEIPFVIDTLSPDVKAERDGDRVALLARDLVSPASALLARSRVGSAGVWSDWGPVSDFRADAKQSVDIEVKDEEGNIGKVSLAIRGRADSTLEAAGSGCGCKTTGAPASGGRAGILVLLAAIAAASARRRRKA